jgi:hypothetical protein
LIEAPCAVALPQLEARVRLSKVNKENRDEGTHNDADGKNSEHELCSPAPIHAVASHDLSMRFERQISYLFESLSGQLTQLVWKFGCGGPEVGARTAVPLV